MKGRIFLLMLVVFVGVMLLVACTTPTAEQGSGETPDSVLTPAAVMTQPPAGTAEAPKLDSKVPEGWKTYSDLTYHYAFAYPADWEVCNEKEGNIQLCKPQKEPGVGPLPSFYVAAIPKNAEGSPFDPFTAEGIQRFMTLKVGESELSEPGAKPPEYFQYTRLRDAQGWDFRAMIIENDHVWEAPPEIKDRRALVMTNDGIFILGSYYGSEEDLQTYQQILETFEFKR